VYIVQCQWDKIDYRAVDYRAVDYRLSTMAIGLSAIGIFSAIGLSEYRISDWLIQETIGLSDIGYWIKASIYWTIWCRTSAEECHALATLQHAKFWTNRVLFFHHAEFGKVLSFLLRS
jgi:hypothetical protein